MKREKYFKGLTRRDYIARTNEIIHQEGIEAVSIRRIAKEMGCSSASLYRYIENRDELLYYAELGEMNDYIRRLNKAEKGWTNVWDIYVGVWYCYSMEAFRKPEAYNLLFFTYDNNKLRNSIKEYYVMFPETIGSSNRMFHRMLQTSDFMGRDYEMCRNCIRADAIDEEKAIILNRMVCMLFKGYFKTVRDEKPDDDSINLMVRQFVRDIEEIVRMLAKNLKGYTKYQME